MRNIASLERGAVACLQKQEIIPTIILLYCWCDAMGAATARSQKVLRASTPKTMHWLATYVVSRLTDNVTAEELWSARHGILHALTPMSDDVMHHGVRAISFTLLELHAVDARKQVARITAGKPALGSHLTLSVEMFAKAVMAATEDCLAKISADPTWRAEFLELTEGQFDAIRMPFANSQDADR